MFLAVLLYLLLPLPLLTCSGFFHGMPEAFEPGSIKLLHFILSHSVDHICIQEPNLNLSSFFRITGFYALRSDRTHPQSSILSPDDPHASGRIIIFVSQELFISELSASSLSLSLRLTSILITYRSTSH